MVNGSMLFCGMFPSKGTPGASGRNSHEASADTSPVSEIIKGYLMRWPLMSVTSSAMNCCQLACTSPETVQISVTVLAEISLRSARKTIIFIIKQNINRIKVSQK